MSRNIVLVSIDSLRSDHCDFLGETNDGLTPVLNELAADGMVFENAIAPGPRTPSSMPITFTGEVIRPIKEVETKYWEQWRENIRRHMARYETVAQRLQDRGYTTVGVTVNPWTHNTGFSTGFDTFIEINGDTLKEYGPATFRAVDTLIKGTRLGEKIKWFNKREWFIRWTDFHDVIDKSLQDVEQPYFLWVFILDAHQPYIAPDHFRNESSKLGMYYASFSELYADDGNIPDHIEQRLREAYRDSVRSVDQFIRYIYEDCMNREPVLVVHSDHGEAFGEHGSYGHEQELYQENLHVPLLISNIGNRPRERIEDPVSLKRLPDILTDIADGVFDPSTVTSDFVPSATETGRKMAVSSVPWKYIYDNENNDEQLYHHGSDYYEKSNLAEKYPDIAAEFRSLVSQYRSNRFERETITETIKYIDEDRRTL